MPGLKTGLQRQHERLFEALRDQRRNRAASAPSITRWSYDSDSGSISAARTLAVPHRLLRPARQAQDGDFRLVDDRRERRAADAAEVGDREAAALHVVERRFPRAPSRDSVSSAASSMMLFLSTSRITGTSRPRSVSTATPMWIDFLKTISLFARSTDALNCGNCAGRRRRPSARRRSRSACRRPFRLRSICLRSASRSVMSAMSCWVTCGIDTRRGPDARPSCGGCSTSACARPRPTS